MTKELIIREYTDGCVKIRFDSAMGILEAKTTLYGNIESVDIAHSLQDVKKIRDFLNELIEEND